MILPLPPNVRECAEGREGAERGEVYSCYRAIKVVLRVARVAMTRYKITAAYIQNEIDDIRIGLPNLDDHRNGDN